ncbi:MAG TPA: hypothetical protein V6C58_05825, partial [Allocoleopsis sp.]
MTKTLTPWLKNNLACPQDHCKLELQGNTLICPHGHSYPVVDGIPIMLLKDKIPTQENIFNLTFNLAQSTPINPNQNNDQTIDPFVQEAIAATGGIMYENTKLTRYPIPNFPLPSGNNQYLLDLGCNWGRWCISAFQNGYIPVGLDPNLEAILAAKRV